MPPLSLDDVRSICLGPFLEREMRAEQVHMKERDVEIGRNRGVSWSGLGHEPGAPRTSEQILRAAESALAQAQAFAASPRGRFVAGLAKLEQQGFAKETAAARAAYARGISDAARAACPAEIGAALSALAALDAGPARDACRALAELLNEALGLAA
jgi:hypothetical protein